MIICFIFISDDAHEDAWRTHEECFEFGGEIPRCMKGAKNLAEVEECLFEVFITNQSVIYLHYMTRVTRVLNLFYTAVSAWD